MKKKEYVPILKGFKYEWMRKKPPKKKRKKEEKLWNTLFACIDWHWVEMNIEQNFLL